MPRRSFATTVLGLLFILYCIEAGAFLVLAPWRDVWVRFAGRFPWPEAQALILHPIARGAVTGFGLVHLVWGVHDLEGLLARRPWRKSSPPAG